MKLLSLVSLGLLQLSATSQALTIWGDSSISESKYPVPGDNPLSFCTADDRTRDIGKLAKVDLSPNPPQKGQALAFTADGVFTKDIEEGAYAVLTVKYGLITILKMHADLCEQFQRIDLNCTVKKGPHHISQEFELPKEIPKGKYTVKADAYTKDDEKITCLEAEVHFD